MKWTYFLIPFLLLGCKSNRNLDETSASDSIFSQNKIVELAKTGELYSPKYFVASSISEALGRNRDEIYNIDLSNDSLTVISDSILLFKNLEFLFLDNNPITNYDILKRLPKLKTLSLQNCELHEIPKVVFELKNLESLYLGVNNISELPKEIGNLKNLKQLYISNNKLISLPDEIVQLKQIEELFLGLNKFTEFPEITLQLKSLKKLYFNMNDMNGWIPDSIVSLKNLEELNLIMTESLINVDLMKKELPKCKIVR